MPEISAARTLALPQVAAGGQVIINIDLSAPGSGGRGGKTVSARKAAEPDGAGRDVRAR